MTPSDQARLLLRKASQDMAVLDKLIDDTDIDDETLGFHDHKAAEKALKALLALAGCDYPRSHNIGLLLDLLTNQGIALPDNADALAALTPFGTVFRYDDLAFEDISDRHSWPPLLHWLTAEVQALIDAQVSAGPGGTP